jgi:hypothetical protein
MMFELLSRKYPLKNNILIKPCCSHGDNTNLVEIGAVQSDLSQDSTK